MKSVWLAGIAAIGLGGCVSTVTIPPQEASIKEACHGKDRALASLNGGTIYRCGEGDRAKYAAYSGGQIFAELNEVDAIRTAAGMHCISQGKKMNSPDFQACQNASTSLTLAQANSLRSNENAEAEAKRERAVLALAAISASAAAGAAAASTPPAYVQPMQVPVTCNSRRLGVTVTTNCF